MTIFFLAFTYKSGLVPSAVTRWPCKKLCKTRVKWFPIQNHHFTFIFNSSDLYYYVFNPLVENECLGSPLDGHSVAAGSWKKNPYPNPWKQLCVCDVLTDFGEARAVRGRERQREEQRAAQRKWSKDWTTMRTGTRGGQLTDVIELRTGNGEGATGDDDSDVSCVTSGPSSRTASPILRRTGRPVQMVPGAESRQTGLSLHPQGPQMLTQHPRQGPCVVRLTGRVAHSGRPSSQLLDYLHGGRVEHFNQQMGRQSRTCRSRTSHVHREHLGRQVTQLQHHHAHCDQNETCSSG